MNEKLKKYLELDKSIKEAEEQKSKLKSYVSKFLRRARRWGIKVPNFSYREDTRFDFIEDELYKWVATQVTLEELEYLTKKTIDLEKLREFILDQKVNSLEIPPNCYTSHKYPVIRIGKK